MLYDRNDEVLSPGTSTLPEMGYLVLVIAYCFLKQIPQGNDRKKGKCNSKNKARKTAKADPSLR